MSRIGRSSRLADAHSARKRVRDHFTYSKNPVPRLTTLFASLLIAALIYLTLVAGIDGDHTLAAMKQLDLTGWTAILGLSLFNYALRFVRWHVYMRWLGHRLPVMRHALIYIAGFALTTTPGKAGEGVRAIYLARLGVSYPHTLAAMFAERFLDLLAITLLSMLVLIAFSDYVFWVVVPIVVLAAMLLAIRRRGLLAAAQRRTAQPTNFVGRMAHGAVAAWDHAFALTDWRPLYAGLALALLAWAAEGLSVFLIAQRLGLPLAVETAIGIYAVGMLVGALSFLPGGLGSTEAAMTLLLKLSGIAASSAIGVVLIARIATLWFAVVLGLFCLAALQLEYYLTRQATTENQPSPDRSP